MISVVKRSPLFYIGDKYKLLKQLLPLFPQNINNFYEPFTGGGSVFLNILAKKYILNDLSKHLISIHQFLNDNANDGKKILDNVYKIAIRYNLSRSFREDVVPQNLKNEYKKTYYAQFNKKGYDKLRALVNENKENNPLILYLLVIYGFNRMLRFNGGGKFNLSVGNVDFNKNVEKALLNYFSFVKDKNIVFATIDFEDFIKSHKFTKDDFVYLDPPYLIAGAEYNKYWGEDSEKRLLNMLDLLNKKNVKFALSNITHYKKQKNNLLINWKKQYNSHIVGSHYFNYHNNGKKDIKEVLITNY
ncbi:MAG: Dam family site-specific DNA-(adenine-N6)-methyltransferase [Endomicrobium sp.]|jgi:DNA adenine methylase|nr:Dam family site-specific DNA-(adenine-N6)-methyltransferase [Endomicrobium sp.]